MIKNEFRYRYISPCLVPAPLSSLIHDLFTSVANYTDPGCIVILASLSGVGGFLLTSAIKGLRHRVTLLVCSSISGRSSPALNRISDGHILVAVSTIPNHGPL